ncbi:MAG: tRNA (cytidine(34)-2'-O)-methyltransferase [Eubacteriales bacterium]|nr:tRNA (cytidine(34)-2'-O)-methyltransferase [Eubacteriales bacterium]
MKHLNIVLVEPEIPQNTGNISRTCACTGASLHLVRPLGFSIDDAHLKRAGLDYWKYLDVTVHDSLEAFLDFAKGKPMRLASTKAAKNHTEKDYPNDCFILFGKESRGLPENLLKEHYSDCVRIPMMGDLRSLNLSNSVAIVVYEALRQGGFEDMEQKGRLREFSEDSV